VNPYEINLGTDSPEEVGETFLQAYETGAPISVTDDDGTVIVYRPEESR